MPEDSIEYGDQKRSLENKIPKLIPSDHQIPSHLQLNSQLVKGQALSANRLSSSRDQAYSRTNKFPPQHGKDQMMAAVSHSLDIVTASHGMGETGFGMGFQYF